MEETTSNQPYGQWRPERYFVMKNKLLGSLKLFVSVGLLIKWFGVNEKTLRNGISKFVSGASQHYRAFKDGSAMVVDYDSLPANCKSKQKLPGTAEEAYSLLRAEVQLQEEINRDMEFREFKSSLEDLYKNRWPKFLKNYEGLITDRSERIMFAMAEALILGILDAVKERWPRKMIFEAFRQIMMSELDAQHQPIFITNSPRYFWRKVAKCRRDGVAKTLVHDMRGVPREHQVKMTGIIKAYIREKFRDPRRYTVSVIMKKVLTKYKVELSSSTVKSVKKKALDRNVLEYDANGQIKSRQNGLPKIIRFLAEAPGDQFQGDWYKLQFYCFNGTKVVRLWAYIVLDVFSRKIVGWSLSEKPLATQAKNAFKMAFVESCFLPEEIIIDNDKIYGRKVFKRFVRRINGLGVITTRAYPNIPTWKAEIESCFGVFQKLHSAKPWYIGESVKSRNIAGNPVDEYVKLIYRQKKEMPTVNEMHFEFASMVKEYNSMTNNRRKKISPQDKFANNKTKRVIAFQDWMLPMLFWKVKPCKRIKQDGRIDLQIDSIEYCYQLTKAEMLWEHKNTDVRMCYNPADMSKIYVYSRITQEFIGCIEPRMVMTRTNKDEVLKRQRRILKDAHQYIKDLRYADRDLVNGKSDRTPVKRESYYDKLIRQRRKQQRLEEEVAAVQVDDND